MDPNTAQGWFFRGLVRFAGQGFINAKYSLVCNGTVIKVKNSAHVRLIQDQFGKFPDEFNIIAPTGAVNIVSGVIPDHYTCYLPASEYLELRKIYQGF